MNKSFNLYSKRNMEFLIAISDGKRTVQELKELMGVDKSNVSRRITDMIEHELVVAKENPDDRRKRIYETTNRGDQAAQAAQQYINLVED